MAQYDVYELPGGQFVVDVQSDLNVIQSTRVVIPLMVPDDDAMVVGRLNPPMTVGGATLVLGTHLIGAVRRNVLGSAIASLADQDFRIGIALDMLISGF